MKEVLVIGNGGREHSIGWKMRGEGTNVLTAPGNAGTAAIGRNIEIDPEDVTRIAEFAQKLNPYLTIVGQEGPLEKGIVNEFSERGLPIFGPTQEAAQIETSKIFADSLLKKYGIPAPESEGFTDLSLARQYIENYNKPCVVKADGLTGGKGVEVCDTKEEALSALDKIIGKYGPKVVIQERLYGQEASVLAIVGKTELNEPALLPLLPAEDYKQLYDKDKGPNTGGLGGVCPHWDVVSREELREVSQKILIPTIKALAAEGKPYTGILYAGFMKTKDGFKVLEFNCRGGDPETQVILPLLKTPLLPVLMAAIKGNLDKIEQLKWSNKTCVGVVLASEGYPGKSVTDREIFGVPNRIELEKGILVFQAGTKSKEGKLVTSGGRVLIVDSIAENKEVARQKAYSKLASLEEVKKGEIPDGKICFLNGHYRTDIARRNG